ncbi:MAG: SPFH domain-containing protein [Gemmataceae bacterium]
MRIVLLIIVLVLLVLLARNCYFTVGPTEYAYVTYFGEPVATYDGADAENDAGLHLRWPWPIYTVRKVDRRLLQFDLPIRSVQFRAPKSQDALSAEVGSLALVQGYVCWRVPDKEAVDVFIRNHDTIKNAEAFLSVEITGRLEAELRQLNLEDLINEKNPVVVRETLQKVRQSLISEGSELRSKLEKQGIAVVDVRIRRLAYPMSVHPTIYDRIREERDSKVQEKEIETMVKVKEIETKTSKEVSRLETEAKAAKQLYEGEAQAKVIEINNKARSQAPEFFKIYRGIQFLRQTLTNNRGILWRSTKEPFWDLLGSQSSSTEKSGGQK